MPAIASMSDRLPLESATPGLVRPVASPWRRLWTWFRETPAFNRRSPVSATPAAPSERKRLHEVVHWRRLAERKDELLRAAAEFNRVINNCETYERTIELVLRFIRNQIGAQEITLYLKSEHSGAFESAAHLAQSGELRFGKAVAMLEQQSLADPDRDECAVIERTIQATEFTLTLSANKRTLGAMKILSPLDAGADAAESREILEHMKALFALSLTKVILRQRSITDPLTGLRNKGYFLEYLGEQMRKAAVGETELGLLMLDIDKFKKVNDTFGHLTGDIILREVADSVRQIAERRRGEAFRYGGEELNVVLTGAELTGVECRAVAEEIRQTIEARVFHSDKGEVVPTTVSVGVAMYDGSADSVEHFYDQADQAVYVAKNAGRNQTHQHGDAEPDKKTPRRRRTRA